MADIKVNMGVTGVAQFKSAMTQSRQAVKTLDAELKLNEAEYKKSGDAETYMAKKAEILKKQIEEQKSVVKAAEDALEAMTKNGTDPASKSYQQMKQQLMNAKTALTNMQGELKNTGSKSKDAAKSTDSLDKSLKSIAKSTSFSAVTSGISSIGSVAQSAASSVIKLGQAIWNMATDSGQYADEVYQLSTNYGVDTDFVQRLRFAEGTTKITAEDYLSMMDKMAKNMTEDRYARLGIDPTGKSRQQLMYEVIDSLNAINQQGTISAQNEVEDLAQSIFGKGFRELGTITTNGTGWFKGVLADQSIVSDENLEKLNAFNQAVNDMNDQLVKLKLDVSAELAKPLTELTTAFTGLVTTVDNWVNSPEGKAMIDKLVDGVAGVFDDITEEDISNAFSAITSAVTDLVGGLTWIKENWEAVFNGIKTIVGIKVGTTILSFINGLSTLAGGGGAAASALTGLSSALGSIGSLALTVGSVALYAGAVYTIAKEGKGWLADEWKKLKESGASDWVLDGINNLSVLLGFGSAAENALEEETKSNGENPGTEGVFIYNPKTGETRAVEPGTVVTNPAPAAKSTEELAAEAQKWQNWMTAWLNPDTADPDVLAMLRGNKNGENFLKAYAEFFEKYPEMAEWDITKAADNSEPIPVTITDDNGSPYKYATVEDFLSTGGQQTLVDLIAKNGWQAAFEELGIDPAPYQQIQDAMDNVQDSSDFDFDVWAEWWGNEMIANIMTHSEEIESMGAYIVSRFMAGAMSINALGQSGGYLGNNNLYIGTMNMNNGTDAYDLAQIVFRQMGGARRGYGS